MSERSPLVESIADALFRYDLIGDDEFHAAYTAIEAGISDTGAAFVSHSKEDMRAKPACASNAEDKASSDGWVLVPKCPTTDMLSPIKEAAPKWNARSIYAAVLEAAPGAGDE
jgi:hypothetical protein